MSHVVNLIHKSFEPGLRGFDTASHLSKLVSNNSLLKQEFSKDHTLVCILYSFFVADSSRANGANADSQSFTVEVEHDTFEALVKLADNSALVDLDLVENNKGSTRANIS